jgi:hypothetical protein
MSDLQEQRFPMRCGCGGHFRRPTFTDAVIGSVRCSACSNFWALLEVDRRSAIDRHMEDLIRAAGVVVKD